MVHKKVCTIGFCSWLLYFTLRKVLKLLPILFLKNLHINVIIYVILQQYNK